MIYLITSLILFLWFAYWSSSAGDSIDTLHKDLNAWQDKITLGHRVPELVLAVSFAIAGIAGLAGILPISGILAVVLFFMFTGISFAGKENSSHHYLPAHWRGYSIDTNKDDIIDGKDGRFGTTRPVNDWIAGLFGWELGDKYYSWVNAATKGFITTLPVGGLGLVWLPLCRELSYHLRNVKPHRNFWMEFLGDGLAYTLSVLSFFIILGAF